jgi:hypothetical protein
MSNYLLGKKWVETMTRSGTNIHTEVGARLAVCIIRWMKRRLSLAAKAKAAVIGKMFLNTGTSIKHM